MKQRARMKSLPNAKTEKSPWQSAARKKAQHNGLISDTRKKKLLGAKKAVQRRGCRSPQSGSTPYQTR